MRPPGIPFVVSGPSGVGKSSLLRRVLESDPQLEFSVSHTTRPPRPGERDGVDYWFVDRAKFRDLVEQARFLEWAEYQGHCYGTSVEAVEEPTRRGRDLILEVEVQGARQLRERLREAVLVFLIPPSLEALEHRLRGRKSDPEEVIQRRLARAREELREVHNYDYVVVNDDLERAVAHLQHIVGASRLERARVLPLFGDRFDFGTGGLT